MIVLLIFTLFIIFLMVQRFDRKNSQLPTVEDFKNFGMSGAQDFQGTTEELLKSLTGSIGSEQYEDDTKIMFQVLRSKGIQWETTRHLLTDLALSTPSSQLVA